MCTFLQKMETGLQAGTLALFSMNLYALVGFVPDGSPRFVPAPGAALVQVETVRAFKENLLMDGVKHFARRLLDRSLFPVFLGDVDLTQRLVELFLRKVLGLIRLTTQTSSFPWATSRHFLPKP